MEFKLLNLIPGGVFQKSHEQQTVAAQDVDRWAYQAACLLFNVLNRLSHVN